MYDGSWIQWREMANREDVNGTTIFPDGNRRITNNPKYSVNLGEYKILGLSFRSA